MVSLQLHLMHSGALLIYILYSYHLTLFTCILPVHQQSVYPFLFVETQNYVIGHALTFGLIKKETFCYSVLPETMLVLQKQ